MDGGSKESDLVQIWSTLRDHQISAIVLLSTDHDYGHYHHHRDRVVNIYA